MSGGELPLVAQRRVFAACGHEGREEAPTGLVGWLELLRMILDSQGECIGGKLHRLCYVVWRPCDDADAIAQAVDGLMVQAVDAVARGVEDGGQPGAGEDVDVVGAMAARMVHLRVLLRLWLLGAEVLIERAATGDVEELHATTDAEQRRIRVERPAGEG